MKLTDLNPHWVHHGGEDVTDRDGNVVPLRERIGVAFDCPCGQCGIPVFIGFENPPDGRPAYSTHHALWKRTGETFDTLTLSPSILRSHPGSCGWHGYVTNGLVTSC